MNLPDQVLRIAEQADSDFPDDIDMASAECQRLLEELPKFKAEIAPILIEQAVRELIYDARHRVNQRIAADVREQRRSRHTPRPRVVVGHSERLEKLYESVYNLRIAGMTLGVMTRRDLNAAAESERQVSEGHLFNALLCERLSALLKTDDKTVRDVVTENRLQQLMTNVRKTLSSRTG